MQVTEQMKRELAENGAILVKGLFSAEQLARMRECFDFSVSNPGEYAAELFGDADYYDVFNNTGAWDLYLQVIKELGLADFVADLWGSEHVWFLGDELFRKRGGKVKDVRTQWHQDTPFFAVKGPQMLNLWTSFEALPKKNSLQIIRGSHLGTEYDSLAFDDPNDLLKPLYGDGTFPRLPDVDAERAKDPASWEVLSWDYEPGDAIVLHSGTVHGGAPVTPDCPDRNTLVFRFYGDQAYYRPLPTSAPDLSYDVSSYNYTELTPGDPYRDPKLPQLR
jgi:hypothetical protein